MALLQRFDFVTFERSIHVDNPFVIQRYGDTLCDMRPRHTGEGRMNKPPDARDLFLNIFIESHLIRFAFSTASCGLCRGLPAGSPSPRYLRAADLRCCSSASLSHGPAGLIEPLANLT